MLLFFSSRRRHTRYWRDWSSDVCSSDLTSLLESATTIRPSSLDEATIFSRRSAPPRPLTRARSGEISSAPSMVKRGRASESVVSGMPSSFARAVVFAEVGTPLTSLNSPEATSSPILRTANVAVEPVPSPTTIPLRSEEHTSELQSRQYLVCRLLLEKKINHSSKVLRNF